MLSHRCTGLAVPRCVSLFVSRCFVLWVNELLRQAVGGLEMLRAVVFIENAPELLRKPCSTWNGTVVLFFWLILLCFLWVF